MEVAPPEPDPNVAAPKLVQSVTRPKDERLPRDLEAAWEAWIKDIKGIDEGVRTLLRAAFKAGAKAADSKKG